MRLSAITNLCYLSLVLTVFTITVVNVTFAIIEILKF